MITVRELLKEQRDNGEISEEEYYRKLAIITRGKGGDIEHHQSEDNTVKEESCHISQEDSPILEDINTRQDEGNSKNGKRADIFIIATVSLSIFLLFAFVGHHKENNDTTSFVSNTPDNIRHQSSPAPEPEPEPEPKSYFNNNRFRNPVIMEDIYNRHDRAYQQSRDSRLLNALYASHLSNRMINHCGWELSTFAAIAKGTLDAFIIIAVTLKTIEVAADNTQSNMSWLQEINDLDMVRRYAYQDLDRFIQDHGGCTSRTVYHLQDGLNWYFVRVAPNLAKE